MGAAPAPPAQLMPAARARVAARLRLGWSGLALAAGLAGLGIGLAIPHLSQQPDPLAANGALLAALEMTPSGEARGGVAPLYTALAADGRVCRVFRAGNAEATVEGAACRRGRAWRLVVLAPAPPPPSGYGEADGAEPPAVAAALDALQLGDPLSPAAEAALRARDWRRE